MTFHITRCGTHAMRKIVLHLLNYALINRFRVFATIFYSTWHEWIFWITNWLVLKYVICMYGTTVSEFEPWNTSNRIWKYVTFRSFPREGKWYACPHVLPTTITRPPLCHIAHCTYLPSKSVKKTRFHLSRYNNYYTPTQIMIIRERYCYNQSYQWTQSYNVNQKKRRKKIKSTVFTIKCHQVYVRTWLSYQLWRQTIQ